MKKRATYRAPREGQAMELKEAPEGEETMIRTQIYLNRAEHEFLRAESARRDAPMAAVIRSYIDEKMEVPVEAWSANPMLDPTPIDPGFKGQTDGAINHDHYVYGAPRKFEKVAGQWVPAAPEEDTGSGGVRRSRRGR
jgi:hypothetical protein